MGIPNKIIQMKNMNILYACYMSLVLSVSIGCSDSHKTDIPDIDTYVPAKTVFDTIIGRIQDEHRNITSSAAEKTTTTLLSLLKAEGSFSDIDYTRKDQSNWQPVSHLDRLKSIVMAYTLPNNRYSDDAAILSRIESALQFWYDKHPVSTNWYMQQIACPQRMGVILILLRSGKTQLSKELERKLIDRMKQEGGRPDQSGSQGTGANKMDIATHWIYRGCLTEDAAVLAFGVEQVFHPLVLTTNEGIQHDYSYQQHGSQLYLGGYGYVLINGITNIASYMAGTPYAIAGEKIELLSNFVRNSYIPAIRGQYFLYNIMGRGVSRKNALYQGGTDKPIERMKALDAAYANVYDAAIKRLKASEPPSYGIQPENTHFWRSDYTLHQRSGYTFDTRTASIYTARNENGNGENLLGYFLTDGANTITVRGNEYADIFPVWDWAMIPGVTAPHLTDIPLPKEWEVSGISKFTGGASDNRYGVSTYLLDDQDYGILTKARKSWFYFDDEVVCLGAGIHSNSSQIVNTTVNQCLLQGTVSVHDRGITQTIAQGMHTYTDPSWVLHDGIGYYFLQGGKISVSNQLQTGDWKTINSSVGSEPVSKEVFKLWIEHGANPQQQTYAYMIVPGKQTAGDAAAYATENIQVLANTESVQVVFNKKLNLYGMVFYREATFETDGMKMQADKGCVLLLKGVGTSQATVYIADPSRKQPEVNLTATLPGISGSKTIRCTFPVHTDPYAGATREYVIK